MRKLALIDKMLIVSGAVLVTFATIIPLTERLIAIKKEKGKQPVGFVSSPRVSEIELLGKSDSKPAKGIAKPVFYEKQMQQEKIAPNKPEEHDSALFGETGFRKETIKRAYAMLLSSGLDSGDVEQVFADKRLRKTNTSTPTHTIGIGYADYKTQSNNFALIVKQASEFNKLHSDTLMSIRDSLRIEPQLIAAIMAVKSFFGFNDKNREKYAAINSFLLIIDESSPSSPQYQNAMGELLNLLKLAKHDKNAFDMQYDVNSDIRNSAGYLARHGITRVPDAYQPANPACIALNGYFKSALFTRFTVDVANELKKKQQR